MKNFLRDSITATKAIGFGKMIVAIAALFVVFGFASCQTESDDDDSPTSYTVTFNTNGGTAVESQSVDYGSTASEPDAPTKDGSAFLGWYSDSALTAEFDFTTPIIANTTVYAKWIECIASVEGSNYYTDFAEAVSAWTENTTLVLFSDIEIDETMASKTGQGGDTSIIAIMVSVTKTLDLNGHTISLAPAAHKSQERVFSVHNANTVLTLKDSSGTNAGKLTGVNPVSDNGWSGALYINNGASVSMYGGTITGNTATNGAGVWIDGRNGSGGNGGTFNMYGSATIGGTQKTNDIDDKIGL